MITKLHYECLEKPHLLIINYAFEYILQDHQKSFSLRPHLF